MQSRTPDRLAAAALCVVLGGCSVALSGGQTTGPGGSTSVTGAATQAQAGFSAARVSASFGAPAPPGAPGGRVSVTNGAAGALILGLVIADLLYYLASPGAAPAESISHTCSCYGYKPPVHAVSAPVE